MMAPAQPLMINMPTRCDEEPAPTIVLKCFHSVAALRSASVKRPQDLFIDLIHPHMARDGVVVETERSTARMLTLVISGRGRVVSAEELAEALYGDDANGGPDNFEAVLKTCLFRARQAAPALGIVLQNERGRGWRAALSRIAL